MSWTNLLSIDVFPTPQSPSKCSLRWPSLAIPEIRGATKILKLRWHLEKTVQHLLAGCYKWWSMILVSFPVQAHFWEWDQFINIAKYKGLQTLRGSFWSQHRGKFFRSLVHGERKRTLFVDWISEKAIASNASQWLLYFNAKPTLYPKPHPPRCSCTTHYFSLHFTLRVWMKQLLNLKTKSRSALSR